ncbi:MAG: HIT family protein, partial [Acidimicrobiales bacterium]
LALCVQKAARAIRESGDPDGVLVLQRNGVVAEQTVPHVHFHVIPRRSGTPFPPAEWVERTSSEQRQAIAARVRSNW